LFGCFFANNQYKSNIIKNSSKVFNNALTDVNIITLGGLA